MNEHTKIAWTDTTWNPTTGCSRVSDGCKFCYAEALSLRFGWSKKPWTHVNAAENVILHPERLRLPYSWKEPKRVFVNSMSDLFHDQIPDEYIARVFAVMADLPQHTFQVLTKRPERAAEWAGPWAPNIWMGSSVEDRKATKRIDHLRRCGARTRFLSCEPLLEDLGDVDLTGIHWVIAGGESGLHMKKPENAHRWMEHAWARSLRDACAAQGVAYFFKQSSGIRTEMGTSLEEEDGTLTHIQEYPHHLDAEVARLVAEKETAREAERDVTRPTPPARARRATPTVKPQVNSQLAVSASASSGTPVQAQIAW